MSWEPLVSKKDGTCTGHELYPQTKWRSEVARHKTVKGYVEWVNDRIMNERMVLLPSALLTKIDEWLDWALDMQDDPENCDELKRLLERLRALDFECDEEN